MDRRRFLTRLGFSVLAAGLGAGAVVAGDLVGSRPAPVIPPRGLGAPRSHPRPLPTPMQLPPYFPVPQLTKVKVPGGTITRLPGDGNLLALTVDDGGSSEVVGAYAEFARTTGMRFTFFVTAKYPSWTDNAAAIRPLVENGQIQLGNHTWSHPDLTKLSDGAIQDELGRTGDFIQSTFGTDARPYFRPPYGFHDGRVDAAARAIGYSTPVLWYGSLSDSGLNTDDQEMQFARQWFLPQHIVIGHANFPTVTHVFDQLAQLIRDRSLQPVTLNDVFEK